MQNTNYFTAGEATLVVCVVGCFLAFCIYMFFKGPKFQGNRRKFFTPCMVGLCFLMLPITTQAAQNSNILASYLPTLPRAMRITVLFTGFPPAW